MIIGNTLLDEWRRPHYPMHAAIEALGSFIALWVARMLLMLEKRGAGTNFNTWIFARSKFLVTLHHVENGKECMKFLHKEGIYTDAPTPDLILLDLNLPLMDGREVLAELVKDDNLNHLPVVVLTTSKDEHEVLAMYKLRCSSFITKPVDFNKFHTIIQNLANYWFTVVVLPSE